ncbi:hypothetical protein STEG23_008060 [Scotinomys teguina]
MLRKALGISIDVFGEADAEMELVSKVLDNIGQRFKNMYEKIILETQAVRTSQRNNGRYVECTCSEDSHVLVACRRIPGEQRPCDMPKVQRRINVSFYVTVLNIRASDSAPETTCPEVALPKVGYAFPHQSSIKKMPLRFKRGPGPIQSAMGFLGTFHNYLCVFSAASTPYSGMYADHMSARYPRRSEEDIGASGTGITDGWCTAVAEVENNGPLDLVLEPPGPFLIVLIFSFIDRGQYLIPSKHPSRSEEMAQHLKALTVLAEDLDSVPSTHIVTHNCL